MTLAHIRDSAWPAILAFMPLASMAAALALFPLSGVAHAEEVIVKIDNFTFSPPELTVKQGTTITWRIATIFPTPLSRRAESFTRKLSTQAKSSP